MGDEGDPDVNAQLAALANGLAGLQTAVTQLVSAVSENVADTARRIDAIADDAITDARARGARDDAAAAPAAAGLTPLVEAIEKLSQPAVKTGQIKRIFINIKRTKLTYIVFIDRYRTNALLAVEV